MTLRSCLTILLLAASAFAIPSARSGPGSCKQNEFWYTEKNCCLPHGGEPHPRPSPPNKSCPPTYWYWSAEQSCCVPTRPPPQNSPPPQCGNGWDWNKSIQCCEPGKPTHTTPYHQPSQTPYQPGYPAPKHNKRSSRQSRDCPNHSKACPIGGPGSSSFECVDFNSDLTSCGGCTSTGEGQDCNAIEGVKSVGCSAGRCEVFTCALGYKRSSDSSSCIKL